MAWPQMAFSNDSSLMDFWSLLRGSSPRDIPGEGVRHKLIIAHRREYKMVFLLKPAPKNLIMIECVQTVCFSKLLIITPQLYFIHRKRYVVIGYDMSIGM